AWRNIGKVVAGIGVSQGRECGSNRTKADRSSGEVYRIRVFGAAGIGLQPPITAQLGEILLRQLAQQILDGMKNGRSMRLDSNTIPRLEEVKIERGHDRND